MKITELLSLDRVLHQPSVSSKKRALEILSESLAGEIANLTSTEIFDCLTARERLGSTGLGHGVAIPHGRMAGAETAVAAMLKLDEGVDYDAPDSQPVDLMVALLVPQESTDEHLALLAQLAEIFADNQSLSELRAARSSHSLLEALNRQQSRFAA